MPKSKKSAKPEKAKGSGGRAGAPRPGPASAKAPANGKSRPVKTVAKPAGRPPKAAAAPAEPAQAPRRKWPKGGPTKADLRRLRSRLLAMERSLSASSNGLAADALQGSGGEFSVDHMADHGSDNFDQDFNLKLLEGEAEALAEVRDALAKIDGGHELPYGLCEACADDACGLCPTCPWIPTGRLEAVPHARLCVQTKELEERSEG
jgi:RNA polymerase-binding transcription factor DksA